MTERNAAVPRAHPIAAASRKIEDDPRSLAANQRHYEAVLLADLCATRLRHGIPPSAEPSTPLSASEVTNANGVRNHPASVARSGLNLPRSAPQPGLRESGRDR